MSWDLCAARIPEFIRTIDDVPKGWAPPPIDSGTKILAAAARALGGDARETALGRCFETDNYVIEVWVRETDEMLNYFMIIVRGGSRAPYVIKEMLDALGCRAFDTASNAIFPSDDILQGWRNWLALRERSLGPGPESLPSP